MADHEERPFICPLGKWPAQKQARTQGDRKGDRFRAGRLGSKRPKTHVYPLVSKAEAAERAGVSVERKIVYYHGCVVDYFDHKTGQAVVQILERLGCTVEVPELICCSFPLLNAGEFDLARKRANKLAKLLHGFVEDGYQVVYSCPTCGHTLKEVYPKLLNSEMARNVADNTYFISSYLLALLGDGEAELEFSDNPAQIAYHTPCHLRSQDLSEESVELLRLIPQLEVEYVDKGCCGMGGSWALRSKYRAEIAEEVGKPLFDDVIESRPEIVATDRFSCGIQIARHTDRPPVHPMHILLDALH